MAQFDPFWAFRVAHGCTFFRAHLHTFADICRFRERGRIFRTNNNAWGQSHPSSTWSKCSAGPLGLFIVTLSRSDYNRTRTHKNSEILRNSSTFTWSIRRSRPSQVPRPLRSGLLAFHMGGTHSGVVRKTRKKVKRNHIGCQAMIETRELLTCYRYATAKSFITLSPCWPVLFS